MQNDSSEGTSSSAEQGTAASSKPAAAAPDKQAEVKLTKAQWRERARGTFRTSPHAIAGALHDRADDEQISEDDVRSALDDFSVTEGTE